MSKETMPSFEELTAGEGGAEEMLPEIAAVESFEELFAALDELGEIKGSRKTYSAAELKKRIEEARQMEILINQVTRAGGLRAKVEELIEKKKGNN